MFLNIVYILILLRIYIYYLDFKINKASVRNNINTYSVIKNTNKSHVKFWYKKTFTKEYHRYVYDLSPFRLKLWIVSIIDRKSFNRYLSIDQFNVIIIITSLHLVMLDKKFNTKELKHINTFYSQFLDDEKRSDLIWLLGLYKKNGTNLIPKLKGNLMLESVVEGVNLYFTKQHKYTLIYYLFELAECDQEISNDELSFIYRLAQSVGVSKQELNSITALYYSTYIPYPEAGFSAAANDRTRKKQKQQQKRTTSAPKRPVQSKLNNAFSIFNLDHSATDQEIKLAYRKMVKQHHPDKVAHLGKGHALKATELIKRINQSYAYLKQVRGF